VDAGDLAVDLQRGGGAALSLGPLSARHIGELSAEIGPLLAGATVSEVAALPPRDLLLFFRGAAEPGAREPILRLRISADGDAPRLHLQTARQTRHEGPLGPFFRRAIADLTGARLRRLEQVARDRIVILDFDATPCGERRALVAELTGRHANLALLGPNERVLEVLVAHPPRAGKVPRLAIGEPWRAPPGAARSLEGPSLAEALGAPPADASGTADPRAPLSYLVQEKLGREVAALALHRARRDLAERIERRLARARSLAHGLGERLRASDDAERLRLDGEALKLHLREVPRGAASVRLADPFAPEDDPARERVIALDPRLGPRENVERIFERYKKLVRARATVEAELSTCRARIAELADLAARVNLATDVAELEREAVERGWIDPPQATPAEKRRAPEPRKPYRSFVGAKGSEIRVGRTAADNDELTFRHAHGNDLWMHTADVPGSHVVLKLDTPADPDPEEVLDAAHLAVHFSPQRGAPRADVHVARRKEVHKPRGAKPGLVTLSGGKVIEVRMQPDRLRRLLSPPQRADSAPE
jgi:predicted ribosome quality control (RQC) complex YloA/Tae2 family protein